MGQTVILDTTRPSESIDAYLAEPTGTPKGGIVVIQEIFGVNAHIRSVADRYAAEGYVAIAPSLFDPVEKHVELGYDQDGMTQGVKYIAELGLLRPTQDVGIAAALLADRYGVKVGTVGYCWGGTVALLAALRLGLPSSSYYGARNVPFLTEPAKANVIFHFGERDHSIPPEMVEKHHALKPEMDTWVYPADHGFNCDVRGSYDEPSAKLAWERSLAFFARELA
ncbi:dienelactone hydrolase family protein [Luteibacter sahnii]|uniref:dienelactone hydrolase family protein n=1 Tax=Luteibacter sahnii TaxID=3021977 RepID=UPI002A74C119|nr:dienelactone hydrolase family protein [Luteibacter sp. PPL193]MDY1550053.1 dienelactone hydrolase family protein [Luteibacter sp. PPL193]